jgi:uncharacterized protein YndB with AHSA1/START domain
VAKRMDIERSVNAPREALFDLMADPATEPDWNPDAIEVHRTDDGPIGAGARWTGRYRGLGTLEIHLEGYERPERLVFALSGSRMDMRWTFGFRADGETTRLTAQAELHPKGALKLASPWMGIVMRRTFDQRPAQLEAAVAARTGRPSPPDGR